VKLTKVSQLVWGLGSPSYNLIKFAKCLFVGASIYVSLFNASKLQMCCFMLSL